MKMVRRFAGSPQKYATNIVRRADREATMRAATTNSVGQLCADDSPVRQKRGRKTMHVDRAKPINRGVRLRCVGLHVSIKGF